MGLKKLPVPFIQWFPWGHWGTRVVFIHPTTLDGHRIEYAARQPTGKPDEMVTSNSLLFSVNGKYQFKQIKHDHTEVATAIIGAGLTIGLKDLFDVASTANLETEPETFAKNLQVVMTDGSVQASEAVPVVNRLIARHNESLGPAGQLEPVANLAEIEELIKQLQPYLEIQAALTPTPDYTVAVLDYTNRVQNPYGHSQVELTLSPSLKGSNAISEYLDAQLRQKEDMARIKARIADLEATYLTTTTDLPRVKADLDTAKEQSAFTEAYYKTRLEKLRSPNPVRYDKLQAGGDRWSFSLAYAIRDADEVGYTVDNGVISIDEDSQKKTPAFLTANYHLVPVPNMDDYTFWQRLTLFQPYAFLGFRTEITEFEPVGGLGITLRLFKSFQLQGWAGWVYSSQTSLRGAELGDAVTENNLSTDEDFEFVAGVAIGWTPKK
ncbi:MAG: hypothetical protein KDL31_11195 [Kiritimatiellae bacterium]|nr:hypothetical protein [Kiritimatiellia bacterium]